MKTVYKLFFSGMLVLVFVSLFSVSSFAQDIEFELPSNYYDLIVNDNVHQSYDYFYIDSDGHYHYAIVSLSFGDFSHPDTGTWTGRAVSPFICSHVENPSSDLYVLPCINSTELSSSYTYVYYKQIVYNTDGSVASGDLTTWRYTGGRYFQNTHFWFSRMNLNFTTTAHLKLFDSNSIVLLNHPSTDYSASLTPVGYDPSSYVIESDFNEYTTSIEDNIYINGTLMYSPSRPDIFELHGYGSIVPVSDGSGNIISYDFNITQDYSQFFESDGQDPSDFDSTTIDDYNSFDGDVQDSLSDFKGEFAFSDIFGDDFDLTSFRGAMIFWQDRFDEVMDFDPVFPTIVVSMLTFGIIAVILGRRLGVG